MPFDVEFDDAFRPEFRAFAEPVRIAIAAYAKRLEAEGPALARPWADTVSGSRHRNMKELRPTVNKIEWRVAYAFDLERKAIVLCAAAKGGKKTAMDRLISTADARFAAHQAALEAKTKEKRR